MQDYQQELQQPATVAALQLVEETADSNPLQAVSLIHSALYKAAATVFPTAPAANNKGQKQQDNNASRQLRKRFQPWFDAECEAVRQQIRQQQLLVSISTGQLTHLAKEALRVLSNKYAMLRQRKEGSRVAAAARHILAAAAAHKVLHLLQEGLEDPYSQLPHPRSHPAPPLCQPCQAHLPAYQQPPQHSSPSVSASARRRKAWQVPHTQPPAAA
jgi:hypothetical protein